MNKQLSLLYVPQTRVFQTFIIALMTIMVFSGFANGVSAERPNVKTIYHIYIDNEHIGTLLDDQPVYQYMTELLDSTKGQYSDVSLQVAEEVRVLPEFVFTEIEEDQSVLDSLEEQLTVQAEVTALMLGEEAIIHLASKKEAKQVIQDLITQYVDEETYSQFIEEEKNVDALEIGETIFTDISLTEELVEKEVLASPQDILTVEEAVNKLTKGVLEEQTYTVKEGDVLGTIADNHNLSTSKLLEINNTLNKDSVIRVGQELKVTAYQPLVEVESTQRSKVEEEIAFETEVREDDSMWKGDNKVTQEGQAGTQVIEYETTYKNGNLIKREVISEQVTKEPVTKIVTRGTKEMPSRGSGQLGWPAVGGYISSYQGNRWGRFHRGIDIARPSNYNILAADNGTITQATFSGGYGNLVRINHNNGMETLYAHLASIDVKVGQTVTKGQKIGVMGSTGNSTGIHLHFEVYENGQLKNPMHYLR